MTVAFPTGTVTFLFTDIEGSAKIWEDHPAEMRAALARHDFLLSDAVESQGGIVFKSTGDGCVAAFATAPDAIMAAVSAQRSIATEPWPTSTPLRVRMALHTGAAELRNGDYFGPTLNRVARLLSIAWGGQTLLSAATQELVRDYLPPQVSLSDLGERRLKDLARPESVFQLLHPDLPADFPPLRSLDNPELPNNLPQQVTSFIGRDRETGDVKRLLAKARLLSLTGSGGTGKTRLALQVAADVLEDYSDGIWLVELAPVTDPALVAQAAATVLGVRETPGEAITSTLAGALKEKRMLLILDNCEHVLEEVARLADALLKGCPGIRLLISSREALGIAGESAYRVPSLSLPDPKRSSQTHTPESLPQYESARLFIERAVAVKADFIVTDQSAPALASVCHRLDGIPLAIELAAARIRSMTVEELEKRTSDRFRILTGGNRTALPRQQTLRALIDWSYDLLDTTQKALIARLAVFSGGWTLEAAEAICAGGGVEEWRMLDVLTALADKSLVIAEEQPQEGATRYHLLETVRQYAWDRLSESGEIETIRERHQAFFVTLAEAADPHLRGAEQQVWLHRLEREHDNLRAALEGEDVESALRLAGIVWWLWYVRGYLNEGRERMARMMARAGAADAPVALRARAMSAAGILAYGQGDYAAARTFQTESLALRRETGDKESVASSLNNLGVLTYEQGDYVEARAFHSESLALRRELGNKQSIATSLNNLALVAQVRNDHEAARVLQEESLTLFREAGDKGGVAYSLYNLGNTALTQGNLDHARSLLEESITLRRELGDKSATAYSLLGLGCVAQAQGDSSGARTIHEESLMLLREIGDKRGIGYSLYNLGVVARAQEDYGVARALFREGLILFWDIEQKQGIAGSLEVLGDLALKDEQTPRAVRLWSAAAMLREECGTPVPLSNREAHNDDVARVRATLSDNDFAAAWTEGQTMTLEQAVEYALLDDTGK